MSAATAPSSVAEECTLNLEDLKLLSAPEDTETEYFADRGYDVNQPGDLADEEGFSDEEVQEEAETVPPVARAPAGGQFVGLSPEDASF